jgi:alkanesulfonate monooxygenase SsuD/methylene tetrahydromethanopterin reductase-like flavin-dependent oxidoreductase (luciferase family)
VARLAEGIDVIRRLWRAEGPVDFDGRFFNLRRAVLGLSPFGAEDWTALAELWEPDAELAATGARPARARGHRGLLPAGAGGIRGA